MSIGQAQKLSLSEILSEAKPTPAAYLKAARHIEADRFEGLKPVRIVFLSTFTMDLLRPYLVVEAAARGMLAEPFFAPFGQLEQQVLDSSSFLYTNEPGVIVLATRLEDIAPVLADRFLSLSSGEVGVEIGKVEARLRALVEGIRKFTSATVLVFNFAPPEALAAGVADPFLVPSQATCIQRANDRLAETCRKFAGVFVFDYARLVCEFGLRRWSDPKLFYLGRIPFGAEAQMETGRRLARYLRAVHFPASKCLVVDLDNTLWGGTVGEDGLGGIRLGDDYPGNAFKRFQRTLLSLRDRGALLAVASKNNEEDALEVFKSHPDCVLRIEDFAALQIHWEDKATSLRRIAEELNIGVDSLVFFDDSPVERGWVASQLPEVTVVEFPESPMGFARALEESGAFDQLFLSDEDRVRAEMYQKDLERKQSQKESVSLEEFLERLEVSVSLGPVDETTLPRVTQLLAKTNQFNLTTRRHTSSELKKIGDSGGIALWCRAADRFGDIGLVGVAIAFPQDSAEWNIDTFVMSCRALGRGVETALLSALSSRVRRRGGQVLIGEYIPTKKNGMSAGFFPSQGFHPVESSGRFWKWDLAQCEVPFPKYVKVRDELLRG